MKYEEFEARAKSAFDNCSEMKRTLWNMQTVVAAVPDMVRKNERLENEKAELKAENVALRAEIEHLKSALPGDYMKLPVDADGVPIHIGDTVWYVGSDLEIMNSEPQKVVGLVSAFGTDGIYVITRDYPDKAIRPIMLTHKQPEPPDSWEKLLGDLDGAGEGEPTDGECHYAGMVGESCDDCPFNFGADDPMDSCTSKIFADIADRIRTLRGEER